MKEMLAHDNKNSFFEQVRLNFHQRRLARWLIVTFPKSTAFLVVSLFVGCGIVSHNLAEESLKNSRLIHQMVHSDAIQPMNDKSLIVIYNSDKESR
jgi:hypothetical protein